MADNYVFSWHKGNIRTITWLEDDSGFISTAGDNTLAVWLLPKTGQSGPNVPLWTYNWKYTAFTASVGYKTEIEKNKSKIQVFCCGSDGTIHSILDEKVQ